MKSSICINLFLFSLFCSSQIRDMEEFRSPSDSLLISNESIDFERGNFHQGIRKTGFEKIVFLEEYSEKTNLRAPEELTSISKVVADVIAKTNIIFTSLFEHSKSSGKIMVQFKLLKDNANEIQFAIKGDIDLKILSEFEESVLNEIYPNSDNNSIIFQLIYRVNTYDYIE